MNNNTPDTEWEDEFYQKFVVPKDVFKDLEAELAIVRYIKRLRSSRDTYWKERVRKDLDRRLEIQKKVIHSEYEGGYTQALKDVKEAHFTNEDNLK